MFHIFTNAAPFGIEPLNHEAHSTSERSFRDPFVWKFVRVQLVKVDEYRLTPKVVRRTECRIAPTREGSSIVENETE